MAKTTTGRVKASINVNWSNDLDIGSVTATPSSSYSQAFTDGVGADKIENVIVKAGTITASGTANIDLNAVLTDPGGDAVNFTKVKAFLIKNLSSSGDGISVGGTFNDYYGAGGDLVEVMPGGCFLLSNPTAAGYAVTAGSADMITLTNLDAVNEQDYEVEVIGEET